MKIESRELFVTFWVEEDQAAVVGFLLGWEGDDPSTMLPVVTYDFGTRVVQSRWKLSTEIGRAKAKAAGWREE